MTSPNLLTIPVEIRQQIYELLTPAGRILNPVKDVDIHSVSHQPPTLPLLLVSKQFHCEILDHHMYKAIWKLNVQYSFNFFQSDSELHGFAESGLLRHIQNVEIKYTIERGLLSMYPAFKIDAYCFELTKRSHRASKALARAPRLRLVVVSCRDSSDTEIKTDTWHFKRQIFIPLALIPTRATIRAGDIDKDARKIQDLLTDLPRPGIEPHSDTQSRRFQQLYLCMRPPSLKHRMAEYNPMADSAIQYIM